MVATGFSGDMFVAHMRKVLIGLRSWCMFVSNVFTKPVSFVTATIFSSPLIRDGRELWVVTVACLCEKSLLSGIPVCLVLLSHWADFFRTMSHRHSRQMCPSFSMNSYFLH